MDFTTEICFYLWLEFEIMEAELHSSQHKSHKYRGWTLFCRQ